MQKVVIILAKYQEGALILSHEMIAPALRKIVLYAPQMATTATAGQFIHLAVGDDSHLLRRPLSIADADSSRKTLTIIYKIAGKGTKQLATRQKGEFIDCMGPLGQAFTLQGEHPLLVGGGIGIAPLLLLAKSLCPRPSEVLMGGRSAEDMIWPALFESVCEKLHVTTDDGTAGVKGVNVELLPDLLSKGNFDMLYTCGPKPMMAAVAQLAKKFQIPCQVSLEEYMACGIGACLSCTCAKTNGGRAKICTDGPVFWSTEVFD